MRIIQLDSHGPDVADWQRFLAEQGFQLGSPDGSFGAETKAATIAFQEKNGLDPDGVCGNGTFGVAMTLGFAPLGNPDDPGPKFGQSKVAEVDDVPVFKLASGKAVFFTARMRVDADGSPHAYKIRNKGLDLDDNAKNPAKPNGKWVGVATDRNGDAIVQGPNDPAPGYLVSTTALTFPGKNPSDPLCYVDSEEISYIVLPGGKLGGAKLGDFALAINTLNKKRSSCIVADIGPRAEIGEASMACVAALLGKANSQPRKGGTDDKIIRYIVFPASGDGKAYGQDVIDAKVEGLLHDLSEDEIVTISS